MIDLDELQKKLKTIAETVNSFKTEAVQLRVVDVLLSQLGVLEAPAILPLVRSSNAPRKPRRRRENVSGESSDTKAKASRKSTRGSGSPGAYAKINELVGAGFFNAPRTIGSIVNHCSTALGHHYKANECSPALLRLLRDQKLKRQKNEEGQYEYTQA